jgi:hypothetical protein
VRSVDAVVIAAVLWCAAGSAAAAEPASLEVTVPDETVRVGDRVPVRVAARGGDDLLWGELQVALDPKSPWILVEGPREIEGARPPVWELVLAPMEVADLALPTLTATVREPGGDPDTISATGAQTVEVASVLPEGDEVEPVPLRDPVGVSGFPWEWVVPLAVPVLAVAAALALWVRRRRSAGVPTGIRAMTPLAEIEALLDRLAERIGREPVEGICDRLAAGMRHYLERQSDQPAEEMTSFELRLLARRLGWPEAVQRGIHEVMGVADSVRFGRVPTDETRLRRAVDLARDLARDLDRRLAEEAEAEAAEEASG